LAVKGGRGLTKEGGVGKGKGRPASAIEFRAVCGMECRGRKKDRSSLPGMDFLPKKRGEHDLPRTRKVCERGALPRGEKGDSTGEKGK